MYSYEARLRTVRLYIKLRKRIGLTVRPQGYPAKNALKTCHREYEQRLSHLPANVVNNLAQSANRFCKQLSAPLEQAIVTQALLVAISSKPYTRGQRP